MTRILHCGNRDVDLARPRVMGILNVTPDSFSDGGQYLSLADALAQARQMVADGATFIDVGGESTRPGAAPVSEQQELDRVIPVIEAIARDINTVISVDTSSPRVMREAARAGAHMLNDVRALQRDGALQAAAATGLPVCLMHMQGEPGHMQAAPAYAGVVAEVLAFLAARMAECVAAGIPREKLVADPGFGFGKLLAHNLALLEGLDALQALGVPLLAGLSRKSMIGALLAQDGIPRSVNERVHGSVAAAVIAAQKGVAILRVHDVAATADALAVVAALQLREANA